LVVVFYYFFSFAPLQAQEVAEYPFQTMQNDLDQGNYKIILSHFSIFQDQCRKDGDNRNLHHYYGKLGQWKNHEALKKWTDADGSSCVPWIAMANACITKGWEYRGTDQSDKVSQENWKIFFDYLDTARFYLEKAVSLNQADPTPFILYLSLERNKCRAKYVMQDYLDKALAISPNNYDALRDMAMYYSPMWCGSEGEMWQFIKTYVLPRPAGSPSRLIRVTYFEEIWKFHNRDRKISHDDKIWKCVAAEFSAYFKFHPDDLFMRSWFAFWAYNSGRYYVAKTQFDILGDHWDVNPNYWLTRENYFASKKEMDDFVATHPKK